MGRRPEKTTAGKNRQPKECASVFVCGVYHIQWPKAITFPPARTAYHTTVVSLHQTSLIHDPSTMSPTLCRGQIHP
jgi:hypothetical protein